MKFFVVRQSNVRFCRDFLTFALTHYDLLEVVNWPVNQPDVGLFFLISSFTKKSYKTVFVNLDRFFCWFQFVWW